ncbi:Uncharacterised protein at_DN0301 [Pycnogonum litorale]
MINCASVVMKLGLHISTPPWLRETILSLNLSFTPTNIPHGPITGLDGTSSLSSSSEKTAVHQGIEPGLTSFEVKRVSQPCSTVDHPFHGFTKRAGKCYETIQFSVGLIAYELSFLADILCQIMVC